MDDALHKHTVHNPHQAVLWISIFLIEFFCDHRLIGPRNKRRAAFVRKIMRAPRVQQSSAYLMALTQNTLSIHISFIFLI